MTPALATERLLLQPLQLADTEQVQQLFPQWEIVRFLNVVVPWPYPPDGALTYSRDQAPPPWGAVTSGTGPSASNPPRAIGLFRNETDNRGFWIAPAWQRQGLVTEAVFTVNDYWFNILGFPVLRAPKAVANISSIRISQKTGMRMIGIIQKDLVSGRQPCELWEILAEEWQAFHTATGR
jgi:RimJ/RimL family protein N-acetyltransferase